MKKKETFNGNTAFMFLKTLFFIIFLNVY